MPTDPPTETTEVERLQQQVDFMTTALANAIADARRIEDILDRNLISAMDTLPMTRRRSKKLHDAIARLEEKANNRV
jgi:hypothetical protein